MVVLDLKTNRETPESHHEVTPDPPEGIDCKSPAVSSIGSDADGLDLTARILSAVQRHVFIGDSFNDLSDILHRIKAGLKDASDQGTLLQSAAELTDALETFEVRVRETNQETAINFKKILSLVNESFSCLQAGSEKADGRLKYFEQSLNQAAKMDSLVALRRHLSGMLDFVQYESKRDVAEMDTRIQSMTDQLRQAHTATSRFRVHMPGRVEAIDHFRELLSFPGPNSDDHATVFVIESLKALRARHGEEIASNILEELGRKQIQPLAPEGKLFCWSGTSLVLTWRHTFGSTSAGLLNSTPYVFEHRAFLGTRVATFKMNVRSCSAALSGDLDDLLLVIDQSSKEKIAC